MISRFYFEIYGWVGTGVNSSLLPSQQDITNAARTGPCVALSINGNEVSGTCVGDDGQVGSAVWVRRPECDNPASFGTECAWPAETGAVPPLCTTVPSTNCACWFKLRCPPGMSRYGDGSACSGGGFPNCDLGYCSNQANGGMLACSEVVNPTYHCGKPFIANVVLTGAQQLEARNYYSLSNNNVGLMFKSGYSFTCGASTCSANAFWNVFSMRLVLVYADSCGLTHLHPVVSRAAPAKTASACSAPLLCRSDRCCMFRTLCFASGRR